LTAATDKVVKIEWIISFWIFHLPTEPELEQPNHIYKAAIPI